MSPPLERPARTPNDNALAVEARDIRFSYSGQRLLLDIPELDITTGQIVSILGPSGCGKTTLLLLLAGLLQTTGIIRVFNENPLAVRASGRMAVVFQNPGLLPWRTVLENLRLPFELQDRIFNDAKLNETLELVGLAHASDRYPDQLSGGMQTRLALARALSTEPGLLLMDEPFGNLDEFNRVRLNLQLAALQRELQMTTIIITHNIHDALLVSDRILILKSDDGHVTRVAEDIPITFANKTLECVSQPAFQQLYNSVVQHFYDNSNAIV